MIPADALKQVLATRGTKVCEDLFLLEALLRDYSPEDRAGVHCLLNAVKEQVPQSILAAPAESNRQALSGKLRERMRAAFYMEENQAQWAVETWMNALPAVAAIGGGVVKPQPPVELKPPAPPPESPKPPLRPPQPPVPPPPVKQDAWYRSEKLKEAGQVVLGLVVLAGLGWLLFFKLYPWARQSWDVMLTRASNGDYWGALWAIGPVAIVVIFLYNVFKK